MTGTGEPRCFPHPPVTAGTSCACACTFFRSSARPVPECFYLLTFSLDLGLDLRFCLGGCRPVELLPDLGPWLWGLGQEAVSGTAWTAPTQASGGSRCLCAPHSARTVGRAAARWVCGRLCPLYVRVRGVPGRVPAKGWQGCVQHGDRRRAGLQRGHRTDLAGPVRLPRDTGSVR